jgi:hypothetical protein
MPNFVPVLRRAGLIPALLCLTGLAASISPPTAAATAAAGDDAAHATITARLKDFMNRYEQNDQDGVVALIDKSEFTMLGGPGEKVTDAAGLKAFMTRNFQQWQAARFTDIRDIDIRVGKDVATAWYQFTFAAGDQPPLPIRVVTTWRKSGKEWLLTQCASWVVQAQ